MKKASIILAIMPIASITTVSAQKKKVNYKKLDLSMYPASKEGYNQVYF
jgi:hypothetical protein